MRKATRLLDNWQFWVGISYFGLALVVVALWVNFDRVAIDQRRTAIITAEHVADIHAQYLQCLKSAPFIAKFDDFVENVAVVHATLLRNSIAAHEATPPGSAFYQAQARNIARLRSTQIDTTGLRIPLVTKKECVAARNGRTRR